MRLLYETFPIRQPLADDLDDVSHHTVTNINYMKENESMPENNPPIGILLCLDRNELYVNYAKQRCRKF